MAAGASTLLSAKHCLHVFGNGLIILGSLAMLLSFNGYWVARCLPCFTPGDCCIAMTAYDLTLCAPREKDAAPSCSSYPSNRFMADSLLGFNWWLIFGSIAWGALGVIYLTVIDLGLPLRPNKWEKPWWLGKVKVLFVALLSWAFLGDVVVIWLVIGVVWIGLIWWFQRKASKINMVVLIPCFVLCPIVGYLLYHSRVEVSGWFMALFANGFVISGMAADYVSTRL